MCIYYHTNCLYQHAMATNMVIQSTSIQGCLGTPRLDPNQGCSQIHVMQLVEDELGPDAPLLKHWRTPDPDPSQPTTATEEATMQDVSGKPTTPDPSQPTKATEEMTMQDDSGKPEDRHGAISKHCVY